MSLCCCQHSWAVVKLCVMALSCAENKLCQPSACPVMMLCLSTTVLRAFIVQGGNCILLPAAAPEPWPCWEGECWGGSSGHAASPGHCGPSALRGAGSRDSSPLPQVPPALALGPLPTLPLQGQRQTRASDQLQGHGDSGQQGNVTEGAQTPRLQADQGPVQVSSHRIPAVLFLTRHLSLTHCLGNKLKHFYVFAARYLIL